MAEQEHFTNFRCIVFGTGLALAAAAFGAQISSWTHWITIGIGYGVGALLMLVAVVLVARSFFSEQSQQSAISIRQASGMMPGIPTLSALLGQNPTVEFKAKQFFALAHYSPITAEAEKNIRIIAERDYPNDKEGFYARFIGIGLVMYQHDLTWLLIFGSQLRAMEELNSRGLIPLAELKKHYDKAVADYPRSYKDYSFDQWIAFMKSRSLVATYPTLMIELSFYGKDFLKYLAHTARHGRGKPN